MSQGSNILLFVFYHYFNATFNVFVFLPLTIPVSFSTLVFEDQMVAAAPFNSSSINNFVSSVRSSSGYHGLLEGSHFFKFFKFFRFESESESERTQHVLYF